MKTVLITAASLIALTAVGTGIAVAQKHGGKGYAQDISINVADAGAIASHVFDRLDRNDDGLTDARPTAEERAERRAAQSLTQEEMQERAASRFAKMDRNADGVVDATDQALAQAERAEFAALFGIEMPSAEAGADGDADNNQGKGRRGNRGRGFSPLRLVMQGVDANALSGLDLNGLTQAITDQLTAMDANADGIVTGDELPTREGRGGRGNRGERGDRS